MGDNPLSDAKLQKLLGDVDSLKTSESYVKWKKSFLKAFESYLDEDGILNAKDADGRLIKTLQSLAKSALKVKSLCENDNICQEQVTAEGRRALANMDEEMRTVERAIANFCPKNSNHEEKVGYDKFELGAVLIRDGFHAYDIMNSTKDFVVALRTGPLDGVLDDNSVKIMDYYFREIQSFIDVMADLGLMKLMKRCVEIYKDAPRPKPKKKKPEEERSPKDKSGEEFISNHGQGPDGEFKNLSIGGSKPRKQGPGVANDFSGKRSSKKPPQQTEQPQEDSEEEEEEEPPPDEGDGGDGGMLIYFDPKTGNIGQFSRDECMTKSTLFFCKNNEGEDANMGVIEDEGEKQDLIWTLKKLEKTKPKEGSWLDEIKKEKAAKKAAEDAKNGIKPDKKKRPKPTKAASERPRSRTSKSGPASSRASTGVSGSSSGWGKSPFEAASSGPAKAKKRSSAQDFQGIYKSHAAKPNSSGWAKVKSERLDKEKTGQ